jgi:membrane protease subunit HflC
MKIRLVLIAFVIALLLGWGAYSLISPTFTFTVDEKHTGVLTQFGRIVTIHDKPGTYPKNPIFDKIIFLENYPLCFDVKPADVRTADKQRIVIDGAVIWRITNPERYVETVPGMRPQAETNLDNITYGLIRDITERMNLADIFQPSTSLEIRSKVHDQILLFGIDVTDVRLKQQDSQESKPISLCD